MTTVETAPPPTKRRITAAQLHVLQLMAAGQTNQAIARRLGITEASVRSRTVALYGKLGARDRAHAVAIGFRQGLLS